MPEPFKCYTYTDEFMKQESNLGWKIPTKWLLSQVSNCYLEGIDEIVFTVYEDKLYMRGIRQTNKDGEFVPTVTWIEEFPPWP